MCAIQRNIPPNQQLNQQPPQPPEPPEPQDRFRWGIFVGIPLVVLAFLWLLKGIEPAFQFEDIMRYLGVLQEERYVRLACLGIVLVAVILIAKVLMKRKD
jgi:hypothetical protein